MSQEKSPIGSVGWFDLTVSDADSVRDFYEAVVGWKPSGLSMGDYEDYVMSSPESGTPVSGVCHKRGSNESLPSQWLIYVNVADVEKSRASCEELGGKSLTDIRNAPGHGKYCVIEDPAGAVLALFEQE